MEASLIDLTRGLDRFAHTMAFQPARPAEDDYEIVIEYVFEHAPINDGINDAIDDPFKGAFGDAFADPWFAAHEEDAAVSEDVHASTSMTAVPAILCFGIMVALAAVLYASTL